MSLEEYTRKRDFRQTAEPAARAPAKKKKTARSALRFVIQKHAATRLHYDFRLEMDGALKSWAVPKGLPFAKGERHLAVHVEDHPLAYIDFEGTIPRGQYGGGTVMVWDHGTYEPLSDAPAKELAGGKLHFVLTGEKLRGEWYLVRLRDENQWLIIKGGENTKPVGKKADDTSALSGRSMKDLARGDRVWQSTAPTPAKPPERRRKPAATVPLPEFVEPMKAKLAAAAPTAGDWLYEIKFDGWRALALKGGSQARLLSRNEKDLSAKFPEVREAVAALDAPDAILDGEIVALDARGRSSFQLLQAYDLGETRPPIFFYAFDLLRWNGESLVARPLEERKAALAKLLGKNPGVIRHSAALGSDPGPLLARARAIGLEGLIGKRVGSRYEIGARSGAWIKLKLNREQEVVIGGYTDPTGARRHFGSLVIGVYADGRLQCVGRVGTGFDAKLLRTMHARMQTLARDSCPFANLPAARSGKWGQGITAAEMKRCHWIEPELVCQVKFSEWTQDNRLRQPVFLGLRADKPAAEVIRETAT